MNLKQIRNRHIDDIFMMGINGFLKKKDELPVELCKTDEDFLRSTYKLFCEIDKDDVSILRAKSKTGMTTALCFIVAYYAFRHKTITILRKPGSLEATLQAVCELMGQFADFNCEVDKKSNQIYLRFDGAVYSTITILNDGQFDISNLKGVVLFTDCNKLKNTSKFEDLLKNVGKYDKIILNFPQSEEIDKLAEDYNLTIKEIQILNG